MNLLNNRFIFEWKKRMKGKKIENVVTLMLAYKELFPCNWWKDYHQKYYNTELSQEWTYSTMDLFSNEANEYIK